MTTTKIKDIPTVVLFFVTVLALCIVVPALTLANTMMGGLR